jgi:hypothetical protein
VCRPIDRKLEEIWLYGEYLKSIAGALREENGR